MFTRAADAARAACPTTHILLHVSGSLSPRETIALCEDLTARHASFDALGVSYYPLWHGSLDRLRTWLTQVGARITQPITIVETAYPWTLASSDDTHNVIGDARALCGVGHNLARLLGGRPEKRLHELPGLRRQRHRQVFG
mgnify:CR=1 FL=1